MREDDSFSQSTRETRITLQEDLGLNLSKASGTLFFGTTSLDVHIHAS